MHEDHSLPLAESVSRKLQEFYDSLPDDERALLEAVLRRAADPEEATGYALGPPIIPIPIPRPWVSEKTERPVIRIEVR